MQKAKLVSLLDQCNALQSADPCLDLYRSAKAQATEQSISDDDDSKETKAPVDPSAPETFDDEADNDIIAAAKRSQLKARGLRPLPVHTQKTPRASEEVPQAIPNDTRPPTKTISKRYKEHNLS